MTPSMLSTLFFCCLRLPVEDDPTVRCPRLFWRGIDCFGQVIPTETTHLISPGTGLSSYACLKLFSHQAKLSDLAPFQAGRPRNECGGPSKVPRQNGHYRAFEGGVRRFR